MRLRSGKGRRADMGFTRAVPERDEWIDYDYYLFVKPDPVVIEAGSRQRGLPCIACTTPIGSQRCYLLCLVAGILCPNDESHLNAAGLFCHVRCFPHQREALIRAIVRALKVHGK